MSKVQEVHLNAPLKHQTLNLLAEFLLGDDESPYPLRRTANKLEDFFTKVLNVPVSFDEDTRYNWTRNILDKIKNYQFHEKIILQLVSPDEYAPNLEKVVQAVELMNRILISENLGIVFDENTNKPILTFAKPRSIPGVQYTRDLTKEEEEFLEKQFDEDIHLSDLSLDVDTTNYLQSRIDEVQAIVKGSAPLATIFLLGSTLEGILQQIALNNPGEFMSSKSAPKQEGNVKKVVKWSFESLIEVSHSLGCIEKDVYRFSNELRNFRNYIHVSKQKDEEFAPNQITAELCWHAFKGALTQIKLKLFQNVSNNMPQTIISNDKINSKMD